METSQTWKELFNRWPQGLPRKGVLLSNLNEAIPFKNFWIKGDIVLLERATPDAMGGRYILIGLASINSVKFIDPLNAAMIETAGFRESEAAEPALA